MTLRSYKKVALVTGVIRRKGIGAAITLELALAGIPVCMGGRGVSGDS